MFSPLVIPPWMPPLQFVAVRSRPFSPRMNGSLCLLPGTSVPLKPEPISKALVAGIDNIACARDASNLSKTGSPRPDGTFRITQVIVPPMESWASFARMIRCRLRLRWITDGIYASWRVDSEPYLGHPFRSFRVRAFGGMFINLVSGNICKECNKIFRKSVFRDIVIFIIVQRRQWWCYWEMDFPDRADKSHDFDTISQLEIFFGNCASCYSAY